MKNQTKPFGPEESLHLITDMIRQAKGNFHHNSFYFLLWGWVVAFINLSIYFLLNFSSYPNPYYLWALTIPTAFVSFWYGRRESKKSGISTHLDRVNASLWICYGIVIFSLIVFGEKLNWQLNPLILLLTAIPTMLTGIIIRFRPLMYGSFVFWLMGILCFMVSFEVQHLLATVAILLGYLLPGYLLRKSE